MDKMKKIKIWGYNVEYSYRDGFDEEINNDDIKHIRKLIEQGYTAAGFYSIDSDKNKRHGWWTTDHEKISDYRIIKILGHEIKYWYNDNFGGKMEDNDIKKIKKLLAKNYKGGELYTNDHYGEWRKI